MVKIIPLFSGSKGNCTLVQSQHTNILLDVGYGYRQTIEALQKLGLTSQDISAIVITHEHSDHINALPMWTRKCSTDIFVPPLIEDYICQRSYCSNVYGITGSLQINDIDVFPYECSHDACQCFGYRFSDGQNAVASITDTGTVNLKTVDFLAPCTTVQIESNHDVNMLNNGPYPYVLKKRILSEHGHLSNAQTAELLKNLIDSDIKNVFLAHLSENNNTAELAFSQTERMYAENNKVEGKDIFVSVVSQTNNERFFSK